MGMYNNILLEIGEKAPFLKYKKDHGHLRMMKANFGFWSDGREVRGQLE